MSVCAAITCGDLAQPEHDPCCSSHGRPLCCKHYGTSHFCIGACDPSRHPTTQGDQT